MKNASQLTRQRGYILSSELVLFAAILVIGLLIGWVSFRDSLNAELIDSANAIESSITFYYFNDPDRGLGPDFVNDKLQFFQPGSTESLGFENLPAASDTGTVMPEGAPSTDGTVTPAQ